MWTSDLVGRELRDACRTSTFSHNFESGNIALMCTEVNAAWRRRVRRERADRNRAPLAQIGPSKQHRREPRCTRIVRALYSKAHIQNTFTGLGVPGNQKRLVCVCSASALRLRLRPGASALLEWLRTCWDSLLSRCLRVHYDAAPAHALAAAERSRAELLSRRRNSASP